MTNAALEASTGVKASGHAYYRLPDGSISSGGAGDVEMVWLRRGGWERLDAYGIFFMDGIYMANHPYEPILMRGGEKEFSPHQIITEGMWQNPPLVPGCNQVISDAHKRHTSACMRTAWAPTWPQVDPSTPRAFPFNFCERALPTVQARDQHESVAHKEEKGQIRSGEHLANAMLRGFGQQSSPESPAPHIAPSAALDVRELLGGIKLTKAQRAQLAEKGVLVEVNDGNEET